MAGQRNGPTNDLVVNRRRTIRELLDILDDLSIDRRLNQWEQNFVEEMSESNLERISQGKEDKMLELQKKYAK